MRYADTHCTYTEKHSPVHTYVFTGKCVVTRNYYAVEVPGHELYNYRQGKLIQEAMPSVSPEDREFLMSGLSPEGWKKTFEADAD